ncbi:hypothetical protein [Desulforamulus aquiferis]|uniref:Uncharacterized protein n=1 Tax=Desulforamulus aquiferis TaxID=1397668 RepID=A0AAW7ZA78_9FIRM|nr:hypothetical protein [Desulforamulus aquiferis]MDO7786301.1 hypothetical protein [Desulforamulus aquiferis]
MSESIEKMLSQLITRVWEDQKEIKFEMLEMKSNIVEMKSEIVVITADISEIKTEIVQINNRLTGIDDKLSYLTSDVRLLEQKTLQNEKELNRMKKQVEMRVIGLSP